MQLVGAKIALLCGSRLLTYMRDDLAHLPFAGHWDLPGGGREGSEEAEDCALRELDEEFGLLLPRDRLIWRHDYPSHHTPGGTAAFFGGYLSPSEVEAIRFGDEGQFWEMMAVEAFLGHDKAVPYLQVWLSDFLAAT